MILVYYKIASVEDHRLFMMNIARYDILSTFLENWISIWCGNNNVWVEKFLK